MQKRLYSLAMTVMLATAACASEHEQNAARFRCLGTRLDGSCFSIPAGCPITRHTEPRCPANTELIPVEEDSCDDKTFCID